MSIFVFTNNASTLAATGILNTDTTVTVTAATGALFPAPSAGQIFPVTVEDTSGNLEIMYCTGRTGDVLTVTRAQESTTALAFASGSRVELRCTAAVLAALLQKNGGDTLSGTTTFSGVLAQGSSGSIQGGEFTGAHRGAPGQTAGQILVPGGGGTVATMNGSNILTTANLASNLPSGFALAQTNMILWWNGSTGTIPSGWHLCDGTGGTPDLRDRFVVGAGVTYALGATGGAITTGSTDPSPQISITATTLTAAQIPSHTHNYWASTQIDFGGSSGQPIQTVGDTGAGGAYVTNIPNGTGVPLNKQFIQNTGGGGSHTHSITGNLAHTHTSLPPYYALYAIMKT
jgi:hypothetical protein